MKAGEEEWIDDLEGSIDTVGSHTVLPVHQPLHEVGRNLLLPVFFNISDGVFAASAAVSLCLKPLTFRLGFLSCDRVDECILKEDSNDKCEAYEEPEVEGLHVGNSGQLDQDTAALCDQ